MLKKLLFILLIIGLIVAGYFLLRERDSYDADYIRAVPADAVFLIEFNNFGGLADELNENSMWQGLNGIPAVDRVKKQVYYIDSLIYNNPVCQEIVTHSPVLLSCHLSGKERFETIGYLHVNNFTDQKKLKNLLLSFGDHTVRDYNNHKIYRLEYKENGAVKTLFFVFSDGLCILSHSSILLEEAVRQISLELSLDDRPGFKAVQKTAGKNAKSNVYINYEVLPKFVARFLKPELKNNVSFIDQLASWTELDLTIKDDVFLLNGFTAVNDSAGNYLGVFMDQPPRKFEIIEIIPSNASMFITFGISDLSAYLSSYEAYLEHNGNLMKYDNRINKFKQVAGADPLKIMKNIFEDEIALVYTDVKNESLEDKLFTVVKTKSKSIALEELMKIISFKADQEGKKVSDFISKYKIDRSLSFNIYELPASSMISDVFGDVFARNNSRYFAVYENYIVFGHSFESLSRFLYDNVLGKTLDTDMAYNELTNYMSSRSNVFIYTKLIRSKPLFEHYLNPSFNQKYEENVQKLYAMDACALQLNASNDMIYNNLFFANMSGVDQKAKTVWESALDTSASCKPFFFTNHYSGENEIFIQDLNHNVYLINKAGRILWKLKLDEAINSEIYQIDYYKNGKYQLLFGTPNFIHIIDREGNYVEQYPLKLRAPSLTGISLFDYDNNKNYRIFVSCEDKHVYNYDKEGKLVKGWAFEQSERAVMTRIRHFRIGIKDYIVFADKFSVYMLNRRGEERVKVKNHFRVPENSNFYLEQGKNESDAKIAITDTGGTVHFISFSDGSVEEKKFESFSANHYFTYEDVDADGYKDFIYVDGKMLKVYNRNEKLMFDHTFDEKIMHQPLYFYFSASDRKLGILSAKDNKIFLFNSDGQLHDGFPLEGKTLFSIAKFEEGMDHFNLIVGTKTKFLYNYTINY